MLADSQIFFNIIFFPFRSSKDSGLIKLLQIVSGTGMFSDSKSLVYTNLFLSNEVTNALELTYFKPYKSQNAGISDFFPSKIPSRVKLNTIIFLVECLI